MRMDQARVGVFRESAIADLPGLIVGDGSGAWLRLHRQDATKAPRPVDYVAEFIAGSIDDPEKTPELRRALAKTVTIEEASDLIEAELLRPENVRAVVEKGIERTGVVKVTLHIDDLLELRREFEAWVSGAWLRWAEGERPTRKSIALYDALFRISAICTPLTACLQRSSGGSVSASIS